MVHRILKATVMFVGAGALLLLPTTDGITTPAAASSPVYALVPANPTFDVPRRDAGAPINHDFEAESEEIGNPPTNHDFGTGSFSGWTTSGTTAVLAGGPSSSGYYARLGNGGGFTGTITSSAFTVDSDAQLMTFKRAYLGTGATNAYNFRVLSGANFGTSTQVMSGSCNCTSDWAEIAFDITPWAGQTIKVRVLGQRYVGFTDVAVSSLQLHDWTVQSGVARHAEEEPVGGYARLTGGTTVITSSPYEVDPTAQAITLRVRFFTSPGAGNELEGFVIPPGGSPIKVFHRACYCATDWEFHRIDVTQWAGQEIQFRLRRAGASGPIGVDDAGLAFLELPGWDVEGLARRDGSSARLFRNTLNAQAGLTPSIVWPAPRKLVQEL